MVGYQDIYFTDAYGKLYEKLPGERFESFVFENEDGRVSNRFLLRKIPYTLPDGKERFDIVTPYGYGGPLIERLQNGEMIDAVVPGAGLTVASSSMDAASEIGNRSEMPAQAARKAKLVKAYETAFTTYAKEHGVVAEFIRFHPLAENGDDFADIMPVEEDRHTVATNLFGTIDDVLSREVAARTRKKCRHLLKEGVSWACEEHPTEADLEDFRKIYYTTMDRDGAGEDYYFPQSYFAAMRAAFPENLLTVRALYEGKTIAMGLYFRCGKILHIHLSGTLPEYLRTLSPAYILRWGLIHYGVEHGYEIIHHGGGRSNAPDDPLYLFKKQFGQSENNVRFLIGRKIWNREDYDALCAAVGADPGTHYFPAYRSKM